MKNILLGILLLGCVAQAQAQERFFKLIDGFLSTSILKRDTSYNLFGLDYHTNSRNVYQFNNISLDGQINDTWQFEFDSVTLSEVAHSNANFDTLNNKVAIVGTKGSNSQGLIGTYLLLKANLKDTISSRFFDLGEITMMVNVKCINSNNTVLLGGQQDANYIVKTNLTSLDSNNQIRWSKVYPPSVLVSNNTLVPINLISTTDNGYLITSHEQVFGSNGIYSQRPVLIKTNSQGIQQWRRYVGDANYLCEGGYAVPSPDGGWLVAWSAPSATGVGGDANREDGIRIEKISSSGATEWIRHLGWFMDYQTDQYNYYPKQFQILPDGNYLVTGNMYKKAFLLKVNTLGEPIWYRVYADPFGNDNNVSDEVLAYSTTPTSDGGFICAGEYRSDPGGLFPNFVQSAFAMKLDEYGCLESGCQVADAVEEVGATQVPDFLVYPNPSAGYLNLIGNFETAEVYDLTGRLLLQTKESHLNIESLAKGMYLVLFKRANQVIYAQKVLRQ